MRFFQVLILINSVRILSNNYDDNYDNIETTLKLLLSSDCDNGPNNGHYKSRSCHCPV